MARTYVGTGRRGGHSVVHSETRRPIESVLINIVYFIFGLIEAILALRFIMLLLGANPEAGFTRMVYGLSAPFMAPFDAVFGETVIAGSVFEWSALLAIVIYALVAWAIASLIAAVTPRASAGTVETVEDVHSEAEEAGAYPRDSVAPGEYPQDEYVEGDRRYVGPGGGRVVHR